MQLSVNRFFSDRVVFDGAQLRVTHSFWDWVKRIVSWIWSPSSYSEENRRTLSCFKHCLIDTLGAERLKRICNRYSLDLDRMERKGSALLSRDVAKIVVGTQDVTVEDINDHIEKNRAQFPGKNTYQDLISQELGEVHGLLSRSLLWQVPKIVKHVSGRPTEWFSLFRHDRFLADRERLKVCQENRTDSFDTFLHNMTARVIKREMEVGALIPAPNHPVTGQAQFYCNAAKVISGDGMVSYVLQPATGDTNLEAIRLFRGTSVRNCEIDPISSVITDLERDLGRRAYESGIKYEPILREKRLVAPIEAGHSLGSTIIQYRLANMDHIRKAWLFCGPGLPAVEVEKFNQKNQPVEVHIRHSKRDKFSSLGQAHIGYNAPPNVDLHYLRYHGPKKGLRDHPHVAVWGRDRVRHGIEGGFRPVDRDSGLYYKNTGLELFRSIMGPSLACTLRILRYGSRTLFSSRADEQRGVRVGTIQEGRWKVEHFR
jgi:hypothetical protein